MKLRSLTLHTHWDSLDVERFMEVAREVNPITIRVSVSPPPRQLAERIIAKLRDAGVRYISILHLHYTAEDMYKYVSQYGVYGTLTDVVEYLQFLKRIYSRGEQQLSRYVSLLLGGLVYNSPYFPASVTTERGITVSLLYPNDIQRLEDIPHVLKIGEDLGRRVAAALGERFLGVDGSLSPWGTESVARAIERLFAVRVGTAGTHDAVYRINQSITTANVVKTGFNEVMLPLAEDEELKQLVWSGVLNLDKLVSYTAVCVPGLDMAPVKVNDWSSIRRLLQDLAAIAAAKRRPLGVRIFPVDVDEYHVETFGNTPSLIPTQ